MNDFVNLSGDVLFSFVCKDRKKDYGGIYFGLTPDSTSLLRKLIHELERGGIGYSRKVGLCAFFPELPERILPGGRFYSLENLRIGVGEATKITIEGLTGKIILSKNGISQFLLMLDQVEKGAEDLTLGGESSSWDDRLNFWIL